MRKYGSDKGQNETRQIQALVEAGVDEAYVAEQERLNIKQRQAEGIAVAKSKGKHPGRPKVKIPDNFDVVYKMWKKKQISAKIAMKKLNLKSTTFYNIVKEFDTSTQFKQVYTICFDGTGGKI